MTLNQALIVPTINAIQPRVGVAKHDIRHLRTSLQILRLDVVLGRYLGGRFIGKHVFRPSREIWMHPKDVGLVKSYNCIKLIVMTLNRLVEMDSF